MAKFFGNFLANHIAIVRAELYVVFELVSLASVETQAVVTMQFTFDRNIIEIELLLGKSRWCEEAQAEYQK